MQEKRQAVVARRAGGKLANWEMRELENGVNANNTSKGNGRVGQVRGEVEGFGRKRKRTEES